MSDYDKLTVVKLREELVKRGLPKTGLKSALVQRLQEADPQSERTIVAPDRVGTGAKSDPTPEEETLSQQTPRPAARPNDAPGREDADTIIRTPLGSELEPRVDENDSRIDKGEVADGDVRPAEKEPRTVLQTTQKDAPPEQLPAADFALQKALSETPTQSSQVPEDSKSTILPSVMTQPAPGPEASLQLPTLAQTQSQKTTMTPIPDTQEFLEDSRKRKRRSQSPPPSSMDMQKRLKADHAKPHVELPEDATVVENVSEQQVDRLPALDMDLANDSTSLTNGHPAVIEGSLESQQNGTIHSVEATIGKQEDTSHTQPKVTESSVKLSPSDTRFKNLFTAPSKSDHSSQQPLYPDTEDRIVNPALHPATSALYIRELMRPLKPESIREHLVALATPVDAPVDPSIITQFFLDSIRTHCLVEFVNISAASRVRSVLHDRIWPNERDRRPLFVDFIPEEKLKKWIDVEQNAPNGRGNPQKRWEVVYEDEDGTIQAYLQEVGANSGGLRAAQPTKADSGQGVKGAPSGPRIRESEPRVVQARPDNGKGFQALDDLFKSTSAKPKLYYQPVAKATVDQRLDKLAAGRGGGRSDEMRRYTFEDNVLVDKAPEFGNRGRGGYGGRGGFSGSYRGRGGGYRGDGYRGESDARRDRRFGY